MEEIKLKDILRGDYKFVLISGEYVDCPCCQPSTSFKADTYWTENALIEHILTKVNEDRMESLWLIDDFSGDMIKYCDIETRASWHNVYQLKFKLPKKGIVLIRQEGGKWQVADSAYLLLYEKNLDVKTKV